MIIMKRVSLRVAKLLLAGSFSISQLAAKTGYSAASVSRAVKELLLRRIVERNNGLVSLALSPLAHELKVLAGKFDLEELFLERKEQLLIELLEGKTLVELQKSIGLSAVQLSRLLAELRAIGAVSSGEGRFFLNGAIVPFALECRKMRQFAGIEPNAVLLFSNGIRLKKLPLNSAATGTLTAFSRFAEFGVPYAVVSDFFVEPGHSLAVEEVFAHALVASEAKKDLAMCLIFYEKNKDSMELRKIIDLAKQLNVLGLFFDCLAFLEKKDVKEKQRFLPWAEFLAIAQNYGVKAKGQRFSAGDLEQLFSEIAAALQHPLSVFLIGGCNMALQGIKAATKDIDLVVRNEKDFSALAAALKKIGFKQVVPQSPAYIKMNANGVFEKAGKPSVDVFTRIVCNALCLSEKMADKALQRKFGLLSVNFLKPEDIILFKAITEREADLDDIAAIIRQLHPDWAAFLRELEEQHDRSHRLFCLDVLHSLELLEEKEKIFLPIKQKLLNLCLEKAILFLAKKPVSVAEIMQKIDFPETAIRNKIQQLVKAKKLSKLKTKPFKIKAKNTKS